MRFPRRSPLCLVMVTPPLLPNSPGYDLETPQYFAAAGVRRRGCWLTSSGTCRNMRASHRLPCDAACEEDAGEVSQRQTGLIKFFYNVK